MIPHAWIDDIATVCSRLFAEVPLRGSTRSEPPWLVVLPTKPMTVSLAFPGVLANFPFQCSYGGAVGAPTVSYHDYSGAFYNTGIWYSDYTYTASGSVTYETAQSWSYKITPTGAVTIVAFFPKAPITDPCY